MRMKHAFFRAVVPLLELAHHGIIYAHVNAGHSDSSVWAWPF